MKNKITTVGVIALIAIWLGLTGFAWFSPDQTLSESERRKLDQWPGISAETVLDGSFMTDFEDYTLDQFPLRDEFRQIKSLFHYYALQQKDNNDIYIADGYVAKILYPLNEPQLSKNLETLQNLYRQYLFRGRCQVYTAVVPDKGYYLAAQNGYLAMDYDKLFSLVAEKLPWATHIDLTELLSISDYYYTDTHWRQEKILPVAQAICQAMGGTGPNAEDFTQVAVDRPFYGVYYGQAALPMEPETMYRMESDLLSQCKVYDYETDSYTTVYDLSKLSGYDPYDMFLSGAKGLLRIENPNATTDKELIVFRDSFGSSLSPLLVQDYASVTLVDLRYRASNTLGDVLTFDGQDVLFLFNTQVLDTTALR